MTNQNNMALQTLPPALQPLSLGFKRARCAVSVPRAASAALVIGHDHAHVPQECDGDGGSNPTCCQVAWGFLVVASPAAVGRFWLCHRVHGAAPGTTSPPVSSFQGPIVPLRGLLLISP